MGGTNDLKYKHYLESIAGPTIEFLRQSTDNENIRINRLYSFAKAFIFTARTDAFGITPIEAMAHGVPVIAYYGGGLKETIQNKKTGYFFYKHTVESLTNVIKSFQPNLFDSNYLYTYSRKFSTKRFADKIQKYINLIK